jgi:cell division protease FtsH
VKPGQRLLKGPLPWVLALAAALWLGVSFVQGAQAPGELTWSEFQAAVEAGDLQGQNLEATTIGNRTDTIEGERREGGGTATFRTTYNPEINRDQIASWLDQGLIASVEFDPEQAGALTSILATVLPFMLILVVFFLLMQNMQGGGGKVMQFGKSKAKMVSKDAPKVTFTDVAGADSAIEELREIKEFLENPAKFQAMGAKIPKGVLLFGPPGPARPSSPVPSRVRPGSPSSRSPARTSSRCSSVSVPRVSATCSSRPRPTRPRSSSWTRSTPSVATAAPAWVGGTTSASRR